MMLYAYNLPSQPYPTNMKNFYSLISLFLLVSCFFSLVLSFSSPKTHHPNQHCLDEQRSHLLQLQQQLYYDSYFTSYSKVDLWDPNTDCCSWKGVTCDSLGHVIGLDLSYESLSGNFHSVFDLHHLQRLNLAGNNFNTTLLSYGFDKLPNLTHLNLSSSCFHGQIPKEISYLTRLVSLDLSHQQYCYWRSNDDPPALKLEKPNFKTFIKSMRSLNELYLDGVNISYQSSEWCETTSSVLCNLQVLSLSSCGLEGPLCPSLSALPFLSKLILDHNPISYLPHKFLENSSHLVSLSLVGCNLSGHFPTEILLLPKIQTIDISYNGLLMGQLPEFPSNNALRSLCLSTTNFSGKLPESIGNLKFLKDLSLGHCHFFGSIPLSISNLSHLVRLDLSNNYFSGSIPSSLFTLPSLQSLVLRENLLVGRIDEFPNASSSLIEVLYLGGNYLSGPLSKSILQLKNLRVLDLSETSLFIESRNTSLADDFSKLEVLWLRSCNLTEFPKFIKTQHKLTVLDLYNNHIHGVVPNWLWNNSLSWVDLSFNPIEHLPLGDENISSPILRYLYLASCNLSVFPEVLRSTENLYTLDLSNNRISGAILNWVGKKSLLFLNLSYNHLSSLDHPSPICNLSQLTYFDVSHNNLSGSIPNCMGNMTQLWYFDASHNNLSGLIPNCLGNMSQLQEFDASHNSLSGLIPNCLGNLTQLISFDASYNNLSGLIPNSLGNMSRLIFFDASHNNLSGQIPNCLGNMSTLFSLNLHGNKLSGTMPGFSKENKLIILKVSENRLEGQLPRSLKECTKLRVFDVGNNMMHDTFPFWMEKLPHLTVLTLRENRFYGQMKHLKHKISFPALDVLDIASNQFSGELSIDFLNATQLRTLKIGGNKLEGKLPTTLAICKKLEVLDLGNNKIHDTFPFWLEKLPSLKVLILRGNRFYGSITKSNSEGGFPMLRILDIASNNFSGDLSIEFIKSLKAMMQITNTDKAMRHYIGDGYYQDSVTIVNKGVELFYEKILTVLTCLDLSNNSFHGRIPEEIHILRSLHVLNLSDNSFSGGIPLTLENLKDLESLDLSVNNLSGKIPPQLASLTFLEAFNLSYNQLEGSIPQSNQFTTFSNDSYIGNSKLCGPPLSKKCNEVGLPMPPPPREHEEASWLDVLSIWQIALVGYASGLVAGICLGYTVLNELGNKWVDKFKKHGKRNRRRSR